MSAIARVEEVLFEEALPYRLFVEVLMSVIDILTKNVLNFYSTIFFSFFQKVWSVFFGLTGRPTNLLLFMLLVSYL